jgi:hypothetical protein
MVGFVVNPIEPSKVGEGTEAGNFGKVGRPGDQVNGTALKMQ